MKMNEPVAADTAEMAWAFPSVDPGAKPLGGRILVQLRRTKKKATSAGIILVEETKETEKWIHLAFWRLVCSVHTQVLILSRAYVHRVS